MQTANIVPLLFALLALVAGVGLLFVRVDPGQLHASSHSMPGLALFRFRAYRYSAAVACLVLAALSGAIWAGFV
jgi:hypothetical protein